MKEVPQTLHTPGIYLQGGPRDIAYAKRSTNRMAEPPRRSP
jgi:hypothetical protein